ncbi:MAG: 4-alpha-glucanotransferase, partial [Oscillospiraceae bacterium]|nr:4-alpha-glucanotransferase [Oscillospiraceae bacterium]
PDEMVACCWQSIADLAVAQMQDFLHADKSGRMNTPSTLGGNWQFRTDTDDFTPELAKAIRKLNRTYGRAVQPEKPETPEEPEETKAPAKSSEPEPEEKPKRKYTRRKTADAPAETGAKPKRKYTPRKTAEVSAEPEAKPKRKYTRRKKTEPTEENQ